VRLDPCHILKYSNQPFAIVAPNKSNPNTLEKKKLATSSSNNENDDDNENDEDE
jgi:hypothetical protein